MSVETRGKKKRGKRICNWEGMGILPLRDHDRRDSATIKDRREGERERERAGHRLLFETDLHKNLLPVFRVQDSLYFCFRLISSSPSFPTMRRKGKEKRKEKEKENPQNAFSPSHPPSMRYIHETQSSPSPGRFKPLYPAAAPHIYTPHHHHR